MKVVSDTSPLNYLVLIDQADLLPIFFNGLLRRLRSFMS